MNIDILYKPQKLWNIALFQEKEMNLYQNKFECPIVQFNPAQKIRTKYHSSTGYADPFLFYNKQDEFLYLFYEEERLKASAPICAKRTKNLKEWEDLGIVLKDKNHLSFPNVFQSENDIFMLPETRSKNAVILYKAVNFPFEWKKEKIILEGDKYVDSSLVNYKGVWWLFTTVWYGGNNGLRIFYSDDLLGHYKEHPMSLIIQDIKVSRNGGTVFEYENKLYRPAQKCDNYYGENVVLYEITKLTPTQYEEVKIRPMINRSNSWSKYGGHHFNMVDFRGEKIVVMDGLIDDNWINNHTRKFFNLWYNRLKK